MNVYTGGTPVSGNRVTLYTSSNGFANPTQCWKFMLTPEYSYSPYIYKLCLYSNDALVANYHQADSTCTLYTWEDDSFAVYLVFPQSSDTGTNDIVIKMVLRDMYLGNTDDSNGANCKWFGVTETIPDKDIWTAYISAQ